MDHNQKFLKENDMYEVVSNKEGLISLTHTQLPELAEPREGASAFILRNHLFIAFGRTKNE